MRWVPASRFEHSNRELLALYICRDTTALVVHEGSLEVPGVPGASLGRLRDVPGGPKGVPGRASQGRSQGSQGRARASQVHPRGSQGHGQGIPEIPWGLGGRPGHPRDPFHKDDSVI